MNRIRAERALKGWTQAQLAEHLDIDTSTVIRWEAGGAISQDGIVDMRRIFGCTSDWLLGLCEERIPIAS